MHKKKDGSFVDKWSNDINVSFSIFIFIMYVSVSMLIAFRIYSILWNWRGLVFSFPYVGNLYLHHYVRIEGS